MKPLEGTTMVAHNHDRCDQERDRTPPRRQTQRSYSAAVPAHALDEHGHLIDQLIHFVFDTLGARHLELRVYEAE
jgi:hypothetical protein